MKRSRKAGLRGELRIERYLRQRQLARCQFRHRVLEPNAAYVAVRRDTHGECELTCKMKCAVTRDSSETRKSDIAVDICRDVVENAPEANLIEIMR